MILYFLIAHICTDCKPRAEGRRNLATQSAPAFRAMRFSTIALLFMLSVISHTKIGNTGIDACKPPGYPQRLTGSDIPIIKQPWVRNRNANRNL